MLYTDISQWEHTVRSAQYDKANWCWRKLSIAALQEECVQSPYLCVWDAICRTCHCALRFPEPLSLCGENSQHPSCATYSLAFPSMFYRSDADAVCIFIRSHTPASSESIPSVPHQLARKLRACPAPDDPQAGKVRSSLFIILDKICIGEVQVEGEEGGVQSEHGGCEHIDTAVRAMFNFARKLLRPRGIPGGHT